ncbi:bromodomain protein [Plasmodium gonderi]|uniref:Bromodomain protein n=1 Tax=Plasmodium gonderi TaxID=77519 RepID=A0A1Y1JJN8_PLAGO|nr:bromodomain protein [Plasmodium gonderi]GAW82719.1 bromodomain protein [Plasmodium gonderi]
MSLNKIKYDELEELRRKNEVMMNLLNKLIAFDKKRVFLYPVNVQFVPDYLNIIKEPMDFTTMKQKIQNFKYSNFQEFEKDFFLIINNCYTYNDKSTIYHRIAENVENYYKKITPKIYRKYVNIHLLYNSEDRDILNNVLYDTNTNEEKTAPVKENKKNLRTKKQGKVGRPSKGNVELKNNYTDNIDQSKNALNSKKKKSNNKNLAKTDVTMNVNDNFYDNIFGSFNINAINDMYAYDDTCGSLENMLEQENFSEVLDTIQNSNDKSKDIFNLLINVLSDNKSNYSTICNYVNISKSLQKVIFGDPVSRKNKNREYSPTCCNENYSQLTQNDRKREISKVIANVDIKNKKIKLPNEEETNNHTISISSNNAQSDTNEKTNTSIDKEANCPYNESPSCLPNNNENNNSEELSENLNNSDELSSARVKTDNFQDNPPMNGENIAKKVKPPDKNSNPETDFVTYNIEKKELTMKQLNYKESVKNFIGEENLPAFIDIFPNIYNILDNADSKNLYYSAFNDLRIFGLDVADFNEFNQKISYNKNYLMGVGRYHIKNVLTLDKNLSNLMLNENNKTQFCDKLKLYLTNNKNKREEKNATCHYNDNNRAKHLDINTKKGVLNSENKTEDNSQFEMTNDLESPIITNFENVNNSQLPSNNTGNSEMQYKAPIDNTCGKRENTSSHFDNPHFMCNDANFDHDFNTSSDHFSTESSDTDNLDMRNFLYTYNSFNRKFLRRQKIQKILKNRIANLSKQNNM